MYHTPNIQHINPLIKELEKLNRNRGKNIEFSDFSDIEVRILTKFICGES